MDEDRYERLKPLCELCDYRIEPHEETACYKGSLCHAVCPCPTVINVKSAPEGWQEDPRYVFIGRPSKWCNPWGHIYGKHVKMVGTREEALDKYLEYITEGEGRHLLDDLEELTGKILVCFCKPKKCHGDILVRLWKKELKGEE